MRCRLLITLVGLTVTAFVPGYAQSATMLRFEAPFDFKVGSLVLPAGQYNIHTWDSGARFAYLASRDGRTRAPFAVLPVQGTVMDRSILRFHCYGETCFLASIWRAGESSGMQLMKSKTEGELAKSAKAQQPRQVTLVAAFR